MAYNNCSEPRVPRWSNPNINYNGTPMGTSSGSCQSCNACTINNTALTVANFRCTSTGVTDVWMKDTWNDNGSEPNPNSAGEPMWISPYIWVRNQQDTQLLHQHQHQNPEFGQDNWVYVKLHNGAATTSGNLELYYANASLSLTWPSGWTQFGSIPVTVPANSTTIVDHQWTNLPASSGHYCLVARWNSPSDPMHATETTDINYNTIQNNNIVWKNMNIVDLVPDKLVKVKAKFRIYPNSKILFVQELSPLNRRTFIEDRGKISFKFDEKTTEFLLNRTLEIENLRKLENMQWALMDSENAVLYFPNYDGNHEGEIEIIFEKDQVSTLSNYTFHVKQNSKENEVGGVSYEIKTRKE